jgi:uncharacterized protein (DUF779 family)
VTATNGLILYFALLQLGQSCGSGGGSPVCYGQESRAVGAGKVVLRFVLGVAYYIPYNPKAGYWARLYSLRGSFHAKSITQYERL